MKIYHFSRIISEIRKGTDINISIFHQLLSSKPRLKAIRHTRLKTDSMKDLIVSLLSTNALKLTFTVLLFMMQLGITISSPFLTNYLIEGYLKQAGMLQILLLIFLMYKLVKSTVGIICDFCYQSLGYEYFARVYWYVLTSHSRISGKMLNLIEYDCNMISNLPYASLTAFFGLAEILVIIGLFTYYLAQTSSFSIFAVIIILYLLTQSLVSFFTFQFTKRYLRQKDKRLAYNINNDFCTQMLNQRGQQLEYNRKFLYTKILSRFVTIIYPMLINLYVFVFTDRQYIENIEYILLILINLIRNPITELLFALNLMVEISNSCQRIVIFNQINPQASVAGIINNAEEENNSINGHIVIGRNLNQERGLIKIKNIISYCLKGHQVGKIYWILLLIFIVLMLVGKFYNYMITKHIVAHTYTTIDFIGLLYQLIVPLIFYYILIVIFQKISRTLFAQLRQSTLNCEYLNRISGDITAIDRSITINLNQTLSSLISIICSYAYSIYSLKNIGLQFFLLAFLAICLLAALKVNRFIMLSRREVTRHQCILKANIIKCLMNCEDVRRSKTMKKSWRHIFQCKQMGLFIENYLMIILNGVLLAFSLCLVGICKQLDISEIDKSILLIACLNVDFDIINMFISAVRLQISLVSFERVLNITRPT